MSKLLISPANMDGNLKSRTKSRTRLRRLEMKEKHTTSLNLAAAEGLSGPYNKEDNQSCKSPTGRRANSKTSTTANFTGSVNESPPLNISHEDPENDEFAGLRLCSQDDGLNQSGERDTECEVRWDCYSPHTVKQLKKLRGQYNAEGVKQIVANFNDAHVKPVESSSMTLLPLAGPEPSAPFKEVKFPHRLARLASKKPRRLTTQKAVQEMILLLQNKTSDREKEQEAQTASSADVVSNNGTKAVLLASRVGNATSERSTEEESEDCWSDDDLFQDNSFLIEATQNPEKFINTSFDMSTKGCHGESQKSAVNPSRGPCESPDSSFIPPSFAPINAAPNKSGIPPSSSCNHIQRKPNLNKNSNIIIENSFPNRGPVNNRRPTQKNQVESGNKSSLLSHDPKTLKSSNTYNAKFAASVNKFANQSSHKAISKDAIQNKISTSEHLGLKSSTTSTTAHSLQESQGKPSFKKFHSFQVGTKASHPSNSSVAQNNCLKRTNSFNSCQSAVPAKSNITSSVISSNLGHYNPSKPSQRTVLSLDGKLSTAKVSSPKSSNCEGRSARPAPTAIPSGNLKPKTTESATEDGFDMSLTDDVLQQLLEVDEVFDSQVDILATGQPKAQTVPTSFCDNSKISPPTNRNLNPLSAASLRVSSLRSSTPVRPFKQRRSLTEPSSSTPVKIAKSSATGSMQATASDSGTELFDSFLNEEVYESQILPILEKIESETKACPPDAGCAPSVSLQSNSPVKCSPEEIEQKRQAALQRRSLRLSQTNRTSSWR